MARKKTSFQIANRLDQLIVLQRRLKTFAGPLQLSTKSVFELDLILEELVSNIILHGYSDDAEHTIEIELAYENQAMTITVTDDGKAFNPLRVIKPDTRSPSCSRGIGGLGIYLFKTLAQEVTYERQRDKNRLVLTKPVTLREKLPGRVEN